jgi:hypothetical protein
MVEGTLMDCDCRKRSREIIIFTVTKIQFIFPEYLSVTWIGDLLGTFWQKNCFIELVQLECKKLQNCHFLLKFKYIDNGSITFIYDI